MNARQLCLDNTPCDKHSENGKVVCKHGLCERSLGLSDSTVSTIVCPLELQRLHENAQWQRFFADLPNFKKAFADFLKRPVQPKGTALPPTNTTTGHAGAREQDNNNNP